MNASSRSSSGSVFERMLSGIASLPTSWSCAASPSSSSAASAIPSLAARSRLSVGDAADVHPQVRLALLERLQQHGVRPAAGDQHLVLLRVEALVGDPERLVGAGRLVGQDRAAERGRDVEAVAALRERPGRPVEERSISVVGTGASVQNSSPPSR